MDEMGESPKEKARKDWVEDAQTAVERVGEALRSAWSATRDTRMSALESARVAAGQLGEAIDRGMAAARERWEESGREPPEEPAGAAEEE